MSVTKDRLTLKSNYHILHDSEFEILSLGQNSDGEFIIASFSEEDEENGLLKYFHVFSDDKSLLQFLKGEISYLNVMQNAKAIYKVTKTFDYAITDYQHTNFDNLDKYERPLKSSFFPADIPDVIKVLELRLFPKYQIPQSSFEYYPYPQGRVIGTHPPFKLSTPY